MNWKFVSKLYTKIILGTEIQPWPIGIFFTWLINTKFWNARKFTCNVKIILLIIFYIFSLLFFLYQTVILFKKGYINIYGHISYNYICLYMFIYIYINSYVNNFLSGIAIGWYAYICVDLVQCVYPCSVRFSAFSRCTKCIIYQQLFY